MSLLIRQVVSTDKTSWNQYVHANSQASAYHNFAWVESVEQAYNHPNVSLIAFKDDKVVGVLPVINMQKPFLGSFLCSLPYCDLGHALADSEQIRDALLNHLQQLKSNTGAKYIEYRDTEPEAVSSAETGDVLRAQKVRMLLSLPDTSEQLMCSFKSKLRSQIRKAEKNGLSVLTGNNSCLLDAFYQVLIYNMRKLGSPVHSKRWYQSLRKNYQDDLLISIVYLEKTPVGGGIVLLNHDKACIPWASTLSDYNRLAPNMLLYWSLLKKVTDLGIRQFDFGRSTYGEGTYKFKQQWGAKQVPLCWSFPGNVSESTATSNTSGTLRNIVEKAWSKLPIGMTTFIGPRIRKYISL